jgi:HD-GYP domain-containing protein (c-di-GMP phosphodiesterase class II)
MIGMRIAHTLGLSDEECSALYDAMLLKDAGSSSNAAYLSALLEGVDASQKRTREGVDGAGPSAPVRAGRYVWRRITGSHSTVSEDPVAQKLVKARSDRGAKVALQLGFPRTTAHVIRSLDEQWDGGGLPDGRRGKEIPLLSRIANLAQTLETVRSQRGVADAIEAAREKRGRWFEPMLVDLISEWEHDSEWWTKLQSNDLTREALALKPSNHVRLVDEEGVDEVARAFADIIDAKSPFTYHHSTKVAEYAVGIAERAGLSAEELRGLRRAAWLHDIGKLGVSSSVLDKSGPLTDAERAEMERHPVYTWEILSRVSAFADFARPAALHHEKLDGSGYPWGVKGDELDPCTRILCVADQFEALTSARPYRMGLSPGAALTLIKRDAGVRLCPVAVHCLVGFVETLPNKSIG